MAALGDPDAVTPEQCLTRYSALFRQSLQQGRMCLCGMVAAEIADVPDPVAAEVRAFFTANLSWLTRVLTRQGAPRPGERAALMLAALEGAMLVARVTGDGNLFDVIATELAAVRP